MSILNEENRSLFGEQVNDHVAKLNDLMSHGSGQEFKEHVLRKIGFANRLLEGSLGMLGMNEWGRTLGLFGSLLDKVAGSTGCWDETLSQIVSEILETEEQVIAELISGNTEQLDSKETFFGLQQEIEVLLSESYTEIKPVEVNNEPVRLEPGAESVHVSETLSINPVATKTNEVAGEEIHEEANEFNTMRHLISSLEKVDSRLLDCIDSPGENAAMIRELELVFGESEFFMGLVGNILRQLGGENKSFRSKVSSRTVLDGVEDFMEMNNRMHGWSSRFELFTDEFSLERKSASELAEILENCMFDIYRMYEGRDDFDLVIDVQIKNEGSYLVARLADNGTDFLSDSQVDKDDAMAFYKGLLKVRGILKKWGCLLWVEPENGRDGRFRFTFPRSSVMTDYHLLSASGTQFAVPCRCIERYMDREGIQEDAGSSRRYVNVSGKQIPVCRLDELAAEEIDAGVEENRIVIMGLAEKRIGIITSEDHQKIEGIFEQLTENPWASITRHTLHIGDKEYPVLDPEMVIEKYGLIYGYNEIPDSAGSFIEGEKRVGV